MVSGKTPRALPDVETLCPSCPRHLAALVEALGVFMDSVRADLDATYDPQSAHEWALSVATRLPPYRPVVE